MSDLFDIFIQVHVPPTIKPEVFWWFLSKYLIYTETIETMYLYHFTFTITCFRQLHYSVLKHQRKHF